jgi:hypothetical protein
VGTGRLVFFRFFVFASAGAGMRSERRRNAAVARGNEGRRIRRARIAEPRRNVAAPALL